MSFFFKKNNASIFVLLYFWGNFAQKFKRTISPKNRYQNNKHNIVYMRKNYTMKKLVKGLMLTAVMTLGVSTANAQGTSTDKPQPAAQSEFWMGEEAATGEFYLYNVGAKIYATDNTPSVTDINNAAVWNAKESNGLYSFTSKENGYAISMFSITGLDWENIKIAQNTTATSFDLKTGTTSDKGNAYKFSVKWGLYNPRYFNVDTDTPDSYYYSAAKTQGPCNDWLFISETQKAAYDEYVALFDKAASYTDTNSELFKSDDVEKTNEIVNQINDALQSYNYNSYEQSGKTKLEDAIKAAEDFINTTTGINAINSASEAKAAEIYGVNGARKSQLTKGLNIVKMSNGNVKKILVK